MKKFEDYSRVVLIINGKKVEGKITKIEPFDPKAAKKLKQLKQ